MSGHEGQEETGSKLEPNAELQLIFALIAQERKKQDARWGADVERIQSAIINEYGEMIYDAKDLLPKQSVVKQLEEKLRSRGQESFVMTALEELVESAEAAEDDFAASVANGDPTEAKTFGEVVQLAAVTVKWLQAILRRGRSGWREEINEKLSERKLYCVFAKVANADPDPDGVRFLLANTPEAAVDLFVERSKCDPSSVIVLDEDEFDEDDIYDESDRWSEVNRRFFEIRRIMRGYEG